MASCRLRAWHVAVLPRQCRLRLFCVSKLMRRVGFRSGRYPAARQNLEVKRPLESCVR